MSKSIYHYTYIITNTTNQMQYIGVRSCNCLPENDDGYMGSSKSLDEAMNKTPEAFTKIIIDTSPTREIANANEQWLHETYDVAKNPEFYNLCIAPLGFCRAGSPHTEETKEKMSDSQRGKTRSAETRKKMSEAKKGKKPSPEARKKMSDSQRGRKHSPETRKKMSAAQSGENHYMYGKTHSPETLKKISEATSGKTFSPETRKKLSAAQSGEKGHWYGKHLSPETRKKMSSPRGPQKKIQCPHCSKIGGNAMMKRHHFNNCREIS